MANGERWGKGRNCVHTTMFYSLQNDEFPVKKIRCPAEMLRLCTPWGRIALRAQLCLTLVLISEYFCVFSHYFDSVPLFPHLSAESRSWPVGVTVMCLGILIRNNGSFSQPICVCPYVIVLKLGFCPWLLTQLLALINTYFQNDGIVNLISSFYWDFTLKCLVVTLVPRSEKIQMF